MNACITSSRRVPLASIFYGEELERMSKTETTPFSPMEIPWTPLLFELTRESAQPYSNTRHHQRFHLIHPDEMYASDPTEVHRSSPSITVWAWSWSCSSWPLEKETIIKSYPLISSISSTCSSLKKMIHRRWWCAIPSWFRQGYDMQGFHTIVVDKTKLTVDRHTLNDIRDRRCHLGNI